MKHIQTGINKMGYSSLAGILTMAFASETRPVSAWIDFVVGFTVVFLLILTLEILHEINKAHRQTEVDRGLR